MSESGEGTGTPWLEVESLQQRLRRTIRVVPDFPQPGILFQDITPVLGDAALFRDVTEALADPYRGSGITHVVGIESRGFIFAAPVAQSLGAGFVPLRKPGKLPWSSVRREYALEYGVACLEMHVDALPHRARVLIVDDVLATGGTARAACELVEEAGAVVLGCAFLLTIAVLRGDRMVGERPIQSLLTV